MSFRPIILALAMAAWLLPAWLGVAAGAAEGEQAGLDLFEKQVRPILVDRCFECHSKDNAESDLQLDSLAGLLTGGSRGPAIVLGDPKKSLLVSAINHSDQLQMPPKQKLSRSEIAAIAEWIKQGAPWPNAKAAEIALQPRQQGAALTEADRNFWAFRPPVKPELPTVQKAEWVKTPIDSFILAALEKAGLQPAPPAEKRTLIRRMTFDLLGLPPTPAEVQAFLADESPDAVSKLIDRLLASPHYGERWARHWLDVARYADSNGLDENLAFGNAFRYRDYVVAAFNRDLPFNQFVQEQIAGDLLIADLPPTAENQARRAAGLTATSFLVMGAKLLAEDDPMKMQMDIIDEQVDVIGRAFMGLTLGCARCHDHKFDPISMADYYALAGILKSTKTMTKFTVVARWQELPLTTADQAETQRLHNEAVQQQQAAIDTLIKDGSERLLKAERAHVGIYLLAVADQQQAERFLKQAEMLKPEEARSQGLLLLEAEDYARGNVHKDRDSYGPGIGVLVNSGTLPNFVEYDLEFPAAGLQTLYLRYAAADARPVKLWLNGQLIKSEVAGKVTGGWYPAEQQWAFEGLLPVQAGKNVLKLEREQPFPHIDRLLLAPASSGTAKAAPGQPPHLAKTVFVEQWAAYLKQAASDPKSPFALWLRSTAAKGVPVEARTENPFDAILLADPQPKSLLELAARYDELFRQPDKLTAPQREVLQQVLQAANGPFALPAMPEQAFDAEMRAQLEQARASLAALQAKTPEVPQTMAVSEEQPENLRIHLRGSHVTLGAEVPRGFPQILSTGPALLANPQQSGRLELARWLTSGQHPLTARVIVNRIWQNHFGQGLVRSTDNFGRLGELPTHPELLDYLAVRFVEDGWSIKNLHRLLLQSATYQMSTQWQADAAQRDPENRLYWHRNRHRLEVEALRDGMLAVSGKLDRDLGGSLLPTASFKYVTNTGNRDPVNYISNRRSIYLPVVRSALYNVFQAFDFSEPSVSNGKRDVTTVAPQALFMMNSELVSDATRAWADQLLAQGGIADAERISLAFESAYARLPSSSDIERAVAYLEQYQRAAADAGLAPEELRRRAWQSYCRVMLAANEFVYVE